MKIKQIVLAAALIAIGAASVYADEAAPPGATDAPPAYGEAVNIGPRGIGANTMQIDIGYFLPLFSGSADGVYTPSAKLYSGVSARLKWCTFLDPNLAVGLDLSGALSWAPNTLVNSQFFYIANIGPHITYFFRAGNWEFPLSFSPALNIMAYESNTYFGFSLRPGIGAYYDVTNNLSFGLNVMYWWAPELYTQASGNASRTRYGNFLEFDVSMLYSF